MEQAPVRGLYWGKVVGDEVKMQASVCVARGPFGAGSRIISSSREWKAARVRKQHEEDRRKRELRATV